MAAALEFLIRVLCDDAVIWKRPLGERSGEYLALAGRGAGTESVAIDDGVRHSLFPFVAGAGRTTVVADADIVAEAIRLYVALLGLLSGRLLDCGIFFLSFRFPYGGFLLTTYIYTSFMRYIYRDFDDSIRLAKLMASTHIRYLWAGSRTIAQPFVKWVGGKRQLLDRIIPMMPAEYGTYHEPFLGGGAVFFAERPQCAYLNDINAQLVACYRAIKSNPDAVISASGEIDAAYAATPDDEKKRFYYDRREEFNGLVTADSDDDIAVAALFLFLNRHCFNGLYRVNRKGLFNVPFNGSKGRSFAADTIESDSEVLQSATVTNGDFLDALARVQPGDFCFIDSPYAPLNPTSFESYAKEGFTEEQHRALAAEFRRLDEIGAKLMLTNHDTDLIHELYEGFDIIEVDVRRSINRNGDGRTGVEVIITNGYENRISR